MPEIRNPNLEPHGSGGGSGGDFRSLITFTLLALAVLVAFQYFKPNPSTPTPQPEKQQQVQQAAQTSAASQGGTHALSPAKGQAKAATLAIGAASESETTVENELYKIVFTNRGAQVKHWYLKKYLNSDGKPLDMVQPELASHFGRPLSLFTYDSDLSAQLNQALYQVMVTSGQALGEGHVLAPATLTFHYAQDGLDVVKTFQFNSSYVIGVDAQVRRNGEPVRALVEWPAGMGDQADPMQFATGKFIWSLDGKDNSIDAKKMSNDATFDQPYDYAAVMDLYFAAAFLPNVPARATVVTLHNSIELPSEPGENNSQKKPIDVIGLAMGDSSGPTQFRIYVGPKATEVLSSVHAIGSDGKPDGPSLEPLIQYGMWTIIAKPLYLALRWLRNLLGPGQNNWGWAIIIVTTVFTAIMLPFRFMAMKSSLKMMRIQPKVEVLKKRYANLKINDPKRTEMNAEMMALYKQEGVNMYGGCLPMLPQIPLFFAYYRVLQYAVELRQAHWLWLKDLSAPDPTYILPILIILSMFLVQILTPSPGMDRNQRRMMAFMMPIFFGFMLLHYASGLALYWATSNLISLALQLVINQSPMGKEMHAIAARRATSKKGNTSGPRVVQGRR